MGKVGMNLGIGLGIKKGSAQIWTPNMVPGLLVEFNARKPVTVYTDNYNKVLEVFDTEGGFTTTENHGILASLLNGTDQYWQLPLPNNVLNGTVNDFISAGSRASGWVVGLGETWNDTTQLGMTGTYAIKISASSGYSAYQGLTVGKKYKLKIRYKSNATLRIGSSTTGNNYANLGATDEWNTTTVVFTAISITIGFNLSGAGTIYIDVISIKEDQGLDLNRDQEQILHSKNWDFERTLGTDILTNTGWASTTDWTGSIDGLAAGISGREDMALEFDGSAEYLQIALPSDLAVFTPSTISAGNAPTGWSKAGSPTITYETTESGSAGCAKFVLPQNTGFYKANLTVGKKYKLAMRYKLSGSSLVKIRTNNVLYSPDIILQQSSEWNSVTIVFTQLVDTMFLVFNSGTTATLFVESLTIKEDQGFDLNKDQEQILHSKNWDFERTLGTELASGTVTIGSKYIVTAGTVEGNAVGTEFLAVTNATTLDASNKVKPIPNLVTNGTFDSATGWSTPQQSSITGGVLSINHTNGIYADYTSQYIPGLVLGKRYMISFEIKNYTQGQVLVNVGGYTSIAGQSGNGVKNAPLTIAYDNNSSIYFSAASPFNFVGDIDNVHIYEIPEWTATGNHTQNLSILDKSGATGQSMLISASGAGISATECVTNGNCATYSGASPSQLATGWLKYSNDSTDTATIVTGSGFSGNAQRIEDTNGNGRLGIAFPIASTSGLKYKATITYRASHSFYFYASGIGTSISTANIPANAGNAITITIDVTPDYSNFMGIGFNADANKIGSWIEVSNISVKQILGEVTLPSANIESVVSGKKYTLEGFARLDPTTLTYSASLLSGDGTSGWGAGNGSGSVVAGEYVLASTGTGYIYRTLTSANKVLKVTFKAKADTYTGSIRVYHNSTVGAVSTGNLTGIYQTFTLYLNSHTAAETFYVQLNSSHTGNIYFDDITIQDATPITLTARLGTKSVTSSALSIVAGTFTKFVLNFEATASEQSQDLKLYLSGAGSVYVDKLSLTQAYDMSYGFKCKSVAGTFMPFDFGTEMYIALGDTTGGIPNEKLTFYLKDNSGINISQRPTGSTSSDYLDGQFRNFIGRLDRTNSVWLYTNGVKETTYYGGNEVYPNSLGKIILSTALNISLYLNTYYAGQISHIQIWRFENISQSTFNSALTGLQYPTGGGAEEVLRLTFSDGTSFANCVKDYSPKNHSISNPGSTMDLTNRKRVQ